MPSPVEEGAVLARVAQELTGESLVSCQLLVARCQRPVVGGEESGVGRRQSASGHVSLTAADNALTADYREQLPTINSYRFWHDI